MTVMIQEEKSNCVFVSRGFGGRGKACSPASRGDTSTPSRCPASSVTTATSLMSPLTPSHAPRGRRICCLVHTRSSPTSTSAHGKNRTQVRKWKRLHDIRSVCCVLTAPCLTLLPDPSCGPIPRIQSGYSLLCDSVILYQCHSGFKLLGSSSVSCDPNSQQWSPTPPTCQGTKPKPGSADMTGLDIISKDQSITIW